MVAAGFPLPLCIYDIYAEIPHRHRLQQKSAKVLIALTTTHENDTQQQLDLLKDQLRQESAKALIALTTIHEHETKQQLDLLEDQLQEESANALIAYCYWTK